MILKLRLLRQQVSVQMEKALRAAGNALKFEHNRLCKFLRLDLQKLGENRTL